MIELELEHVRGPLAGRSIRLPAAALRVTVGTDPGCDVVFPAAAGPVVASEHCDLVRDAGRYELRVNRDHPVWVNGRAALDGEELLQGSTVALGRVDGPAFVVHYQGLSREEAALASARRHATPDDADVLRTVGRGTRRVALLGAAAAVVLAVAGLVIWRDVHATREDLEASLAAALKAAPAQARPPEWSRVIAAARPSVYLVVAKAPRLGESVIGTAWVIAPGRLATNAHVAQALLEAASKRPQLEFVVRAGVPPYEDVSLESARIHPAYAPFAEAWEKYQPLAIEASGAAQPREFVPGYDVAILNVAEGATLGPPLRRAGLAKLETLQSGMPVSFIGFPLENLVARDLARPAAESQTASLVGFTTFTRMQPVEGDGQLIEHSLPATGGASGSPIFDAEGEVIAILSGGNVMMAEEARLPNAALVNFAQRIDVIEPLLAATGGFDLDAARARWQVDLAHYDNPETEATRVLEARLQDWRKRIGAKVEPQPVLQETLTISTDDRIEDLFAVVRRVDGAGAGHYLVSVRGLVRHDFDALAVQLPSQRASADGGAGAGTGAGSGEADADRKSRELARDASHSAYATLSFDLDGDGGFSLLVADSSLRAGGAPARCELTVYHLPR